jgi:type IV pilus assembly protein PilE
MQNRNNRPFGGAAGFTLIELMVVITIGAILLSIAIPSYQSQIRKSRRTDARNAVLDLASREERYLSVYNLYSQTPSDLGYATAPATTWAGVGAIGSGYYTLSVRANAPDPTTAPPTPPTYIITATATGTQLKDTDCRTFTVNQLGQQTATDSSGAATTACWN